MKKQIIDNTELRKMFERVPEERQSEALLFVQQLSFMIKTLDELKKDILENGVTEDFKQGVQEFKRESQSLKSYNTTMKTYNTTMTNFLKLLEPEPNFKEENKGGIESDEVLEDFWNWLEKEWKTLVAPYKKQRKPNEEEGTYNFEKYAMNIYNKKNRTRIAEVDLFVSDPFEDWQSELTEAIREGEEE